VGGLQTHVPEPSRCCVGGASLSVVLPMQVAAVSNTPLVSQAVNSPLVARSLLADPAERDSLLSLPYSRTPKGTTGKHSLFHRSYWLP
jgi:hypothetical protein